MQVENKDDHAQEKEKCKYDASEKVDKRLVKTDSSMSDSEGFILRPRTPPPKSSSSEVPTHQHIDRQVMGKKGLHGRKRKRKGRSDATDHEDDEEVALHKEDDKTIVTVTNPHSTVNTLFPLPYAEDGGAAETTFSQSEDMLEHLCIEQ